MAKYDNTRFYWLQLKENFFDDDAIDWIEDQPNGEKYSLFYLKLCLKSLKTNGVLIRNVGTMLIPYDHIKLGELTRTDPDTVIVAMELFFKVGLVKKLENGELYISQVENMIGSQSKSAFKKQQQIQRRETKMLEGGQKVENFPPKIDIELEQDLDIEIKEKNNKLLLKKKEFVFPSYDEVQAYAEQRGRGDLAKTFFDFFSAGDWRDSNGKPVQNWKQKFITWETHNPKKVERAADKPSQTPNYRKLGSEWDDLDDDEPRKGLGSEWDDLE